MESEYLLSSGGARDFDVAVLGAGISGLVSASVLAEQGHGRILVIDQYPVAGGNHIDVAAGGYTFDIGSFIFQGDSPLLDHFPEILPLYVPITVSFGRLNPEGRITRYPLSPKIDIVEAGPLEWARIGCSVIAGRLGQARQENAWEFARYWLGAHFLKRSGLENYMERFNGLPAREVDVEFARKRMGWIKEHASVHTHVTRAFRPMAAPTNTQLVRPIEGFERLYAPAIERLKGRGVTFAFSETLERIESRDGQFHLSSAANTYAAKRVISTIPVAHALQMCGLPADEKLQSVELISLFFSFDGERGFPQPVLFNFAYDGAWKRLTMHSDFYGRINGREYFNVEVVLRSLNGSIDAAASDFFRHVAANGLFKGDLRLEGGRVTANAYPLYAIGAVEQADLAIRTLKAFGVESFGRQGGFDYQPTARVSALNSEAMLKPAAVS